MSGIFCEVYGNTISNRVLEFFLENQELGIAVGDMSKELGISRPKAYSEIEKLLSKNYISPSRVVGRTQLYVLNKSNLRVKLFVKDFKECLKILIKEDYSFDESSSESIVV